MGEKAEWKRKEGKRIGEAQTCNYVRLVGLCLFRERESNEEIEAKTFDFVSPIPGPAVRTRMRWSGPVTQSNQSID
jgi:hypothetical protein